MVIEIKPSGSGEMLIDDYINESPGPHSLFGGIAISVGIIKDFL